MRSQRAPCVVADCGAAGSARARGARGRRFKPCQSDISRRVAQARRAPGPEPEGCECKSHFADHYRGARRPAPPAVRRRGPTRPGFVPGGSSTARALAQWECSRPITGRRKFNSSGPDHAAKVLVVAPRSATPKAPVRLRLAAFLYGASGVVACTSDCDSESAGSIPARHPRTPRRSSQGGQGVALKTRRSSFNSKGRHQFRSVMRLGRRSPVQGLRRVQFPYAPPAALALRVKAPGRETGENRENLVRSEGAAPRGSRPAAGRRHGMSETRVRFPRAPPRGRRRTVRRCFRTAEMRVRLPPTPSRPRSSTAEHRSDIPKAKVRFLPRANAPRPGDPGPGLRSRLTTFDSSAGHHERTQHRSRSGASVATRARGPVPDGRGILHAWRLPGPALALRASPFCRRRLTDRALVYEARSRRFNSFRRRHAGSSRSETGSYPGFESVRLRLPLPTRSPRGVASVSYADRSRFDSRLRDLRLKGPSPPGGDLAPTQRVSGVRVSGSPSAFAAHGAVAQLAEASGREPET